MEKETIKIPVGAMISMSFLVISILSALMFLFMLFMPNRWHYECLGRPINVESGTYVVDNEENQTADTYPNRVIYKTFDGNVDTAYYHDYDAIIEMSGYYGKQNAWKYVYKYRTWSNCVIWLFTALGSFIAFAVAMNNISDKTLDIKVKPAVYKLQDEDSDGHDHQIW